MKKSLRILFVLFTIFLITNCNKKEEIQPTEEINTIYKSEGSELDIPDKKETKNSRITSPDGYKNLKEVTGDLDGDKEEELVIVYDTKEEGEFGTIREIQIYKKANEKWNLFSKSSGAILPSLAGGMMGDPFEDISIDNGSIVIKHFGGSRGKWNYTHRFRFQKGKWILIGATAVSGSPCEEFKTYDFNLLTNNVNETISNEFCDENGALKGKPKVSKSSFKLKEKKLYSLDGFEPGSNKVNIPSQKNKSFYF